LGWVSNPFVGLAERSFGVSPGIPMAFGQTQVSASSCCDFPSPVCGRGSGHIGQGQRGTENTEDVSATRDGKYRGRIGNEGRKIQRTYRSKKNVRLYLPHCSYFSFSLFLLSSINLFLKHYIPLSLCIINTYFKPCHFLKLYICTECYSNYSFRMSMRCTKLK
jgi:hypothetical protein